MLEAREPILADIFERANDFSPEVGSLYLYGENDEERSRHFHGKALASGLPTRPLEIKEVSGVDSVVDVCVDGVPTRVALRSADQLVALWPAESKVIYLDITGLAHHVWAPLLKSLLGTHHDIRVIYVEPSQYARSIAPTEGQPYDLSSRILGIRPLPGFASLVDSSRESILVPLLGFEGARLAFVVEQVQPVSDRVYPIVGLPGFQPGYVYQTLFGNRRVIADTDSWERVVFAPADCPFSVMRGLDRLRTQFNSAMIKIALIGTKPHALGGVLYKIVHSEDVELIYDHPIRSSRRTTGTDRLHVYYVSAHVRHVKI